MIAREAYHKLIAPTFAPLAECGIAITRLERPKRAINRSSFPKDRLYCQGQTAVPPHANLAHPSAIAARMFVSHDDTRCLLYAPVIAPGGAA